MIGFGQNINRVKVYLDCWGCDGDFLQREMPYIDFYQDAKTANLHIIVNAEISSNGGEIVTFRFIGVNEFENVDNTLTVDILPNTSNDSKRKEYLEVLKKGVYAYIIRSKSNNIASLSYLKNDTDEKEIEKDKWNNWSFRISTGGYLNGEESYSNSNSYANLSTNRITQATKFTSNLYINSSVSKYKFDDSEDVIVENKSKQANMTYVKSKGEHFSIGAIADYSQSTFRNYNGQYKLSPCIEYNTFPYSESSEHRMSILYGLSANYHNYIDTTVYLKNSESFVSHLLELSYQNSQTWGSFSFSINSNQILDKNDLQKYNVRISSNIDWNIVKGLSLNYWAYINFDRAQIHLPLNGATYEEIILRQKELESNYFYYINFGLSYTFGSMKNSVVNPRFN
jgi:hypothetical protein